MIVKAAAKINLMLDVVGKLPNGYHSLFMIMQSVSCYDTVRVDRTGKNGIKIISSDERVPKDEKNIAYKAAEAFFDYAGISDRGIEIEIGKKIPMAAGLAGGSADGAGVLYILNRLYKTGFDEFTLCSIGEKSRSGRTVFSDGRNKPLRGHRRCYSSASRNFRLLYCSV